MSHPIRAFYSTPTFNCKQPGVAYPPYGVFDCERLRHEINASRGRYLCRLVRRGDLDGRGRATIYVDLIHVTRGGNETENKRTVQRFARRQLPWLTTSHLTQYVAGFNLLDPEHAGRLALTPDERAILRGYLDAYPEGRGLELYA